MSYGIKLNMALTQDDEGVSGGLHIVDSDGMDISSESTGSSMMDVVAHLAYDAADLVKESMEPTPQSIIDTLIKDMIKTEHVIDPSDLWGVDDKNEDCDRKSNCDRECDCDHCCTSVTSVPFSAADAHEVSEINAENDELTVDDYIEMFAEIIKEEAFEGNFTACVYSELLEDDDEIPAAVDEAIEHYLAADFSLSCENSILKDGCTYVAYTLRW